MTIQWKSFLNEKPEMRKDVLVRFRTAEASSPFSYYKITHFKRPFDEEKNKYSESYYEYYCFKSMGWIQVEDQSRVFWEYLDK